MDLWELFALALELRDFALSSTDWTAVRLGGRDKQVQWRLVFGSNE